MLGLCTVVVSDANTGWHPRSLLEPGIDGSECWLLLCTIRRNRAQLYSAGQEGIAKVRSLNEMETCSAEVYRSPTL